MKEKQLFSYSKINTFQNCRELYYINYIQKIRKVNENIEAYLGSCVHKVIEYIYSESINDINLDDIIFMYDKVWKDRWHDKIYIIDRSKKVSQYYNLGIECLRIFYKRNIHSNAFFLKNTAESEMNVEFNLDGIDFRGIIDRLDFNSEDNQYIINDYILGKQYIPKQ